MQPKHGRDEWQVGRVNVQRADAYKILVTTSRNEKSIGYVAIDDFEFTYGDESCTIEPPEADPTLTTTTTTTTTTIPTTAPHGTLPDCDFTEDSCGWLIGGDTDMMWFVSNSKSLSEAGLDAPKGDMEGNNEANYMYVSGLNGTEDDFTDFETPMNEIEAVEACMLFYFNIYVSIFTIETVLYNSYLQHNGGIKSLKIFAENIEGYRNLIWELSDFTMESNEEWWIGQVNFKDHQVQYQYSDDNICSNLINMFT